MTKSVIHQLTEEQLKVAKKRLNELEKTNNGGKNDSCKVVKLTPTKLGGYAQMHIQKGCPKVLVHVLSFWIHKGAFPEEEGKDISHLCNTPLCINPDHLVRESTKINQKRKGCKGTIKCPHCIQSISICDCDPTNKCL
jgi:hypothetical protein